MIELLKKLIREEEGQTMVEYGLVIAGIAVAGILVFQMLGQDIMMMFGDIMEKVKGLIDKLDV
jgi:pilus assembly protein Flp/PilA